MIITREIYPNKSYWDDDFELQVMCDNLKVEKGMKILDVGCLDSFLADVFQDNGCEVWGVDLRNYGNPHFKFIRGDFNKVKLPVNYFDVVYDIGALHHFGIGYLHNFPGMERDTEADIKAALKIKEILKPGGFFYVSTDSIGIQYEEGIGEDSYRIYTLDSWKKRIASFFKVLEIKFYERCKKPFKILSFEEFQEVVKGGGNRIQLFAKLQKENER